jgi:hypothetical protein
VKRKEAVAKVTGETEGRCDVTKKSMGFKGESNERTGVVTANEKERGMSGWLP